MERKVENIRDVTPATGRQKRAIARLCIALRIREEIEQEPMTTGEAGKLIKELEQKLKIKKERERQ